MESSGPLKTEGSFMSFHIQRSGVECLYLSYENKSFHHLRTYTNKDTRRRRRENEGTKEGRIAKRAQTSPVLFRETAMTQARIDRATGEAGPDRHRRKKNKQKEEKPPPCGATSLGRTTPPLTKGSKDRQSLGDRRTEKEAET